MQAVINADNGQLRYIATDDTEIVVSDNTVAFPTFHINDMGTRNTIIMNVSGSTLPGMTDADMRGWRRNSWVYNPHERKFEMVRR